MEIECQLRETFPGVAASSFVLDFEKIGHPEPDDHASATVTKVLPQGWNRKVQGYPLK